MVDLTSFTPVSALVGGALIATSASLLFLLNGEVAGISGIVGRLVRPNGDGTSWRALFVAGLLSGGVVLMIAHREAFGGSMVSLPLTLLAGFLVGFGTRLGSGCTSGHGVCGLARLSPRSLAATVTFMAMGMLATTVVRHMSAR